MLVRDGHRTFYSVPSRCCRHIRRCQLVLGRLVLVWWRRLRVRVPIRPRKAGRAKEVPALRSRTLGPSIVARSPVRRPARRSLRDSVVADLADKTAFLLPSPRPPVAQEYGQTMSEDRPYIEANTRQRERLRALIEALDDEALAAPCERVLDSGRRARSRRLLGHPLPDPRREDRSRRAVGARRCRARW